MCTFFKGTFWNTLGNTLGQVVVHLGYIVLGSLWARATTVLKFLPII